MSDIQEAFLEEVMKNDAEACLKLFMTWQRSYKAEVGADLKQQVEAGLHTVW